jgi:hypothetical protein
LKRRRNFSRLSGRETSFLNRILSKKWEFDFKSDRLLAAAAVGFSASAFRPINPDHLEADSLQVKLLTHTADEVECFRVRLMHCAKLNLDALPGELRICFVQLPVENK